MISLFGTSLLTLALIVSFFQCILPAYGYYRHNFYLLNLSKVLSIAAFTFIALAYCLLTYAFLTNDYTLIYVAKNSHETLPFWFKFASLWGAHEGSMLLWVLVLQIWSFLYIVTSHFCSRVVLANLGGISFLFLLFLLFTSNPFMSSPQKLLGQDLNPLLQDPGFLFHPPFLFMGYVGFALSFTIALAALIEKNFTKVLRETRMFVLAAFSLLTIGILLGAWWAYRVLGFGGFWFWDPVENVSLLPWFSSLALIHILLVAEKKPSTEPFALLLLLITFCLSVLGTFLVRSGVLISVHTFASDPSRGIFLLIILGIFVLLGFAVYLWRLSNHTIHENKRITLNRETWLFLASLLWLFAMLTVLVGTLYPLLLDVLKVGMLSVGAPYFNSVLVPFVAFILGAVSLAMIQQAKPLKNVLPKMMVCWLCFFIGSLIFFYYLTATFLWSFSLLFSLALSVIISHLFCYRYLWNATLAHVGFAVMIIGIILSSILSVEKEVTLSLGQKTFLGPYQFTLGETKSIQGSNYRGLQVKVNILKNNRQIMTMLPEKRIYSVRDMVMTKVAIHPSIFRDIYISLGEPINEKTWVVHLYYKPFIRFILFGVSAIALGCFLSLLKIKESKR